MTEPVTHYAEIDPAELAVYEAEETTPSEPTAAQQGRAKWAANERADRAEARLNAAAAELVGAEAMLAEGMKRLARALTLLAAPPTEPDEK